MNYDLAHFCLADVAVQAGKASLKLAVHTDRGGDGVNTLRYCGDVVGHYQRARTHRGAGAVWRGVTPSGTIVYARSEAGIRRELLGRYA